MRSPNTVVAEYAGDTASTAVAMATTAIKVLVIMAAPCLAKGGGCCRPSVRRTLTTTGIVAMLSNADLVSPVS
jgi:hypothetical protein